MTKQYCRLLFCFLTHFIFLEMDAQLISAEKEWKTYYPIWDTFEGVIEYETTRTFFFEGDTLIDDQLYQQLHYYNDSIRTAETEIFYYAPMREQDRKVYFYQEGTTGFERMIYNFNMEVNDTILDSYDDVGLPISLVVDSISFIEIKGIPKKIYFIHLYYSSGSGLHNIVIEDYGNLRNGILYPDCFYFTGSSECGHELLCVYEQAELVFMHPEQDFCFVDTSVSSEDIYQSKSVRVFPNPFDSFLNIKLDNSHDNSVLTIYDSAGNQRMKIDLSKTYDPIDLNSLENGLYIIHLGNVKKNIIRKIIKG